MVDAIRDIPASRFLPPTCGTTAHALHTMWLASWILPDLYFSGKLVAGLSGVVLLFCTMRLAQNISPSVPV